MCDTMVALPAATRAGVTLFAKNSDREPDEAQNLVFVPRSSHPPGATVKCTYTSIPQVRETAAALLSQPFWMFGAEMGVNEHGVAIGNETIFTRERPGDGGLTGMDLLRLALERSRTAAEARDVIVALLEAHGQGGNCGYRNRFYYHNGFLIADRAEAYVLETFKTFWAWKKVNDVWTISNFISLEDNFDQAAPGLIDYALDKGWCRRRDRFSFRRCYSDLIYTRGGYGEPRSCRSLTLLASKKGGLEPADLMAALRDHGADPAWMPHRQKSGTVCMHAANNLLRPSQTTASLVAAIAGEVRAFATGSSTPCLSPFFPVRPAADGLPKSYAPGGESYDPAAYWWLAERFHRQALPRFAAAQAAARSRIAAYEREMLADCADGIAAGKVERWFGRGRALVEEWGASLGGMSPERLPLIYSLYWRRRNRRNRIPA